jgi:radical SAM-linked protein
MFVHHTNMEEHASDRRKLVCYDCGVACDMNAMREKRSDFLIALRADKPRVQAPATESEPAQDAGVQKKRRGPPARIDQGEPLRLRLHYEKLGRAAFGSHLDLVRMLPRLFKRLSVPVYYSLGFNQKPVMVFGPALSLGLLSLAEYVDLKVEARAPIDLASLPEQLSAASVDGLRFVAATALGNDDPKLSRVIDEAVYVAGLPAAALELIGALDAAALAQRLQDGARGDLVVRRDIDGIGKRIDVGRFLLGVRVGEGADALQRAGLRGELVPVELRVAIRGDGTAKPTEVLEALLGRADVPARFVRAELLCTQAGVRVAPLDLEGVRSAFAARRAQDAATASAGAAE